MERATIQDALDYCLENPEGLSAEELLARFPEYREELASLLGLAANITTATGPAVPTQRREAMKARLMQAAVQGGRVAAASPDPEDAPTIPVAPIPLHRPSGTVKDAPARRALPWFLRPGWVAAAAALLLMAFVWWSSADALPDSPFYRVRLASESVALGLAGSDADRTRVRLGLANNRLYDLRAMQERGKLAQAQTAFDSYSSNLDNAVKTWRGLPDQPHTDLAQLLYASSVAGEVTFQGFGPAIDNLPATLQQKIRDTLAALSSVNSETSQSLAAANIDPAVALGKAGNDLAPLLTPVPSTVIGVPTYTPVASVPIGGASPTVHASSTATMPNPSSTTTATTTSTATMTASPTSPAATSTPTIVPARPDPTRVPPRRTPTRTPRPVPPSHTRVPPPLPTATHLPVPPSATPMPPPPPEPTSPPREATVCDLRISDVTATCPGGCLGWTATVHNKGDTPVDVGWTAELQIMQRGGGFDAVTSQSGTSSISPGDSIVKGKICYNFPPNTSKVRVEFYIDTDDNKCPVPSHKSRDISPCK